MYKLIMIDLDGTLLNDDKKLNDEDVAMINRAFKERGVMSVIATGRTYTCVKYIAEKAGEGLSQYIISSNGAGSRTRFERSENDVLLFGFLFAEQKWCTLVREVATVLKEDLMSNNYSPDLFFSH